MEGHVGVDDLAPGGVVGEAVERVDGAAGGLERDLPFDREAYGLELERRAELEDVVDVVGVEDRQLDPALGSAAQQALGDQRLGRGAERVAGDAEPLGELGLAKAGARLQLAAEDHLAQRFRGRLDRGDGAELDHVVLGDVLLWCFPASDTVLDCSTILR